MHLIVYCQIKGKAGVSVSLQLLLSVGVIVSDSHSIARFLQGF